MQFPEYSSYYLESVARLMDGEMRPEFVLIPERFVGCADRFYCFQAVDHAIRNMKNVSEKSENKKETNLYNHEKIFYSEVQMDNPKT